VQYREREEVPQQARTHQEVAQEKEEVATKEARDGRGN
jgi:hypothetical protein